MYYKVTIYSPEDNQEQEHRMEGNFDRRMQTLAVLHMGQEPGAWFKVELILEPGEIPT